MKKQEKPVNAYDKHREAYMKYRDERYKNVPEHARVPYSGYNDRSANSLTKMVQDFMKWNSHMCTRMQSQGQWDQRLGIFRRGTVTRGAPDLIGIINGTSVHLEIKYGKDKQSTHQQSFQQMVERSGGKYFIVKTWPEFYAWYIELTNTTKQ